MKMVLFSGKSKFSITSPLNVNIPKVFFGLPRFLLSVKMDRQTILDPIMQYFQMFSNIPLTTNKKLSIV